MTVTVRFFARARDAAGTASTVVALPDRATVGMLRRHLADVYPSLRGLLERSAIAVNNEYAGDDTPLAANVEVALLPPVSGG
jgi:molybdopterin converting factor subunit 1